MIKRDLKGLFMSPAQKTLEKLKNRSQAFLDRLEKRQAETDKALFGHSKGEPISITIKKPQRLKVLNGRQQTARDTRRAAGLTQAKFAASLGKSPATIADWEGGRRSPSKTTIILMKKLYKKEVKK